MDANPTHSFQSNKADDFPFILSSAWYQYVKIQNHGDRRNTVVSSRTPKLNQRPSICPTEKDVFQNFSSEHRVVPFHATSATTTKLEEEKACLIGAKRQCDGEM